MINLMGTQREVDLSQLKHKNCQMKITMDQFTILLSFVWKLKPRSKFDLLKVGFEC